MAGDDCPTAWRAVGASVRGASHRRDGRPNQDAIAWHAEPGADASVVMAVSDGHGSRKYFRSDAGAQFAVAGAVVVLREFLDGASKGATLSAVKRAAEERLPQDVIRRWHDAVSQALRTAPLSTGELDALEQSDGATTRKAVEDNPSLAYGATLLTVVVTPTFILYLQLGDGDILTVSEAGDVSRPLIGDDRLFANETTSLCAPHAWRDVRVGFQALADVGPALILLSTDGYANSFRDEAGFLKVGSDLLDMIRAEGSNRPPSAVASGSPTSGNVPLTVRFDAAGSADADGDPLMYNWAFGDGSPDGGGPVVDHIYTTAGSFTATLTVSDGRGGTGSATVVIQAGNTPPTATISSPASAARFSVGQISP